MPKSRCLPAILRRTRPGLWEKANGPVAAAVPTWAYITLERSTPDIFLDSTSLGDFVGGTSMSVVYTFVQRHQPSVDGTNYVIDGRGTGSGWAIYAIGASNTLRGFIYNGAGTLIEAPSYTVVVGNAGKVMQFVLTYDGSTVRSYTNGSENGSGTATTGYTAPSGQGLAVGGQTGAGLPSEWHQPVGLAADLAVLSGAQVSTLWTDTQAALDVPSLPTGGTKFTASDWAGGAAAWDSDGAQSMAVSSGAPVGPTPFTPTWGS